MKFLYFIHSETVYFWTRIYHRKMFPYPVHPKSYAEYIWNLPCIEYVLFRNSIMMSISMMDVLRNFIIHIIMFFRFQISQVDINIKVYYFYSLLAFSIHISPQRIQLLYYTLHNFSHFHRNSHIEMQKCLVNNCDFWQPLFVRAVLKE